jgi:acyl-CoA synthetase (NDP forming)
MSEPGRRTPIWSEYPRVYPALIRALDQSEEVDSILVSITDVPTTSPDLADALCATRVQISKPICVFWGSRDSDIEPMQRLQSAGIPCYRSTTSAVDALVALTHAGIRY